jgi:3D (Asp-Asp-Asp) domain-containing protein
MKSPSARRRRALTLSEVGLFVVLVSAMFALASARPGGSVTEASSAPSPSGLALMNINTAQPVPSLTDPSQGRVPPASALEPDTAEVSAEAAPTFNNRPLRLVRQITMLTTAYSPDEKSCGKWADGFTASGYSVWTNGMKLVAADTTVLPFGSIVTIPGYHQGRPVPVLDRGGKIKGNRLDLLYPTHEIALKWGVQRLTVDVWEYAD